MANVLCAAFSPDGTRIALGFNNLSVWDVATARKVFTVELPSYARHVAFSPDGTKILYGDAVRDATTGQEKLNLKGHTGVVYGAAFSPNGTRILSAGGADGTFTVWDASTGQAMLTLRPYTNFIKSVAFTRDGQHIVSLGRDEKWGDDVLKVWEAPLPDSDRNAPR